jgi:hypothetical protein
MYKYSLRCSSWPPAHWQDIAQFCLFGPFLWIENKAAFQRDVSLVH